MTQKTTLSRRIFIKKAGMGLAVTTFGLAGCSPKEVVKEVPVEVTRQVLVEATREVAQKAPAAPWKYVALDVEKVRKLGHARYYDGDCSYGAFAGIIEALQDIVGFPYTQIPTRMMEFGAGGVAGWGTTCGALIGASAAINLVTKIDLAKKLVDELMTWYSQTPFPSQISNDYAVKHQFLVKEYKTDKALPQSVSNSPLCHVSVTEWCKFSKFASGSKERSERCGRLTGDVTAKAVELLNVSMTGSFSPSSKLSQQSLGCMTCHTKGENFAIGQYTQGKMECVSCHDPH